ncbi:MAG: hypothetical protein ACI4I1_11110 [Oscillospiraceae bacterium]
MDKILVEIKCAATSNSYEFKISKKLSAGEGIKKILNEIRLFESNEKLFEHGVSLISARTGSVLNPEMSFAENGITGGDILMII